MTTDRRELLLSGLAMLFLAGCGGGEVSPIAPEAGLQIDPKSNFHRIYDDPKLAESFKLFLVNVFHLFPEDKLHALIAEATQAHGKDEDIYRAIQKQLPQITPVGSTVTFALPALKKQKQVMAAQSAALVGEQAVDGYLEIGTTGRYLNPLRKTIQLDGDVFIVNTTAPSKDPVDVVERGQIKVPGTFVDMGDYDPIAAEVPDGSVGLVSNFIGFHHCPLDRLDAFVGGIRRVLRPGGVLLLREHNVTTAELDTMVALAHDVFNAGTGLDWAGNAAELRKFRSVAEWTTLLEGQGFKRRGGEQFQEGDPTDNALLAFEKV